MMILSWRGEGGESWAGFSHPILGAIFEAFCLHRWLLWSSGLWGDGCGADLKIPSWILSASLLVLDVLRNYLEYPSPGSIITIFLIRIRIKKLWHARVGDPGVERGSRKGRWQKSMSPPCYAVVCCFYPGKAYKTIMTWCLWKGQNGSGTADLGRLWWPDQT